MDRTKIIGDLTQALKIMEGVFDEISKGRNDVSSIDQEDKTFFMAQALHTKNTVLSVSVLLSEMAGEKASYDLVQIEGFRGSCPQEVLDAEEGKGDDKSSKEV